MLSYCRIKIFFFSISSMALMIKDRKLLIWYSKSMLRVGFWICCFLHSQLKSSHTPRNLPESGRNPTIRHIYINKFSNRNMTFLENYDTPTNGPTNRRRSNDQLCDQPTNRRTLGFISYTLNKNWAPIYG